MIGLYLHVPFCTGKCPYCDFYSIRANEQVKDRYKEALIKEMELRSGVHFADTLYFGGGTPTLLETAGIASLVDAAKRFYKLGENDEVTIEANPCTITKEKLKGLREAGVNRLSIGVQSGVETELKALGRKHSLNQASMAVALAKQAGFDNISVDIMMGIPGQTKKSLKETLEFVEKLGVDHCSFYQLKIEPNTPFGKCTPQVLGEDETAELYLIAAKELEKIGLKQYEISNFAKEGKQCRHNLKYWEHTDYLGFGPAAHSFLDGKRFYHERDFDKYIDDCSCVKAEKPMDPVFEWLMLRLRLNRGVTKYELKQKDLLTTEFECKIIKLEKAEFVDVGSDKISLTPKGMLVQYSILLNLYNEI